MVPQRGGKRSIKVLPFAIYTAKSAVPTATLPKSLCWLLRLVKNINLRAGKASKMKRWGGLVARLREKNNEEKSKESETKKKRPKRWDFSRDKTNTADKSPRFLAAFKRQSDGYEIRKMCDRNM